MKPRTALQRTVAKLSAQLPPLSEYQERWIKRNAMPAMAFRSKKNTWCTACGQTFSTKKNVSRCPVCGAEFEKVNDSPHTTKFKDAYYSTIFTTCKGFQVVRHFIAKRVSRKSREPEWSIDEVVQVWISQDGRQTIMARKVVCSYYYDDLWRLDEPMSIKEYTSAMAYSYRGNRYDIYSSSNLMCRILPIIKRNGFKGDFHRIIPSTLLSIILKDNVAESLLKTRQYSLLRYVAKGGEIKGFLHAVNICNRNGYIVKDAHIWLDYLKLLDFFGLDTHNAHYSCPKDLQAAHDRLVDRKKKVMEAERRKQEQEKAIQEEEEYRQKKGRYFGVLITEKNLSLHVLQSVAEFVEEGNRMHHCVFANEYYKKEDSLVLSAQNAETGEHLETVEYDMVTHRVVQSRGKCNEITEFHEEIIALCERKLKGIEI